MNNSVTEVRSYFEVDSEETEEKVKEVIKLAKQGCFAESLVRNAIPLVSTCLLNGNEISVP